MTTTVRSDHAPRRVDLPDGYMTWLPSTRKRHIKPISDLGVETLVVLAQHGPLTTPQIAQHLDSDERAIGYTATTMLCRGQIARHATDDLRTVHWRCLDEGELP